MESTYLRLQPSSEALEIGAVEKDAEIAPEVAAPRSICRKVVVSCGAAAAALVIVYAAAARAGVVRGGCFGGARPDEMQEMPQPPMVIDYVGDERDGCKVFFDGCNTCVRDGPDAQFACTEMACFREQASSCTEYFEPRHHHGHGMHGEEPPMPMADDGMMQVDEPPTPEADDGSCERYFDGCNRCHRSAPGAPLACTMMMCTPEQKTRARCVQRFAAEKAEENADQAPPSPRNIKLVDADAARVVEDMNAPANCALWDSGCNKCRRGAPGGGLACTRMMCHGAGRTPRCMQFFDTDAAFDDANPEDLNAAPRVRAAVAPAAEAVAPENCRQWFDGCNMCRRASAPDQFACTRMACPHYQEAKCVETF